nr:MAG TPA: hypothetical protein [Herelleviridae sp.]
MSCFILCLCEHESLRKSIMFFHSNRQLSEKMIV